MYIDLLKSIRFGVPKNSYPFYRSSYIPDTDIVNSPWLFHQDIHSHPNEINPKLPFLTGQLILSHFRI